MATAPHRRQFLGQVAATSISMLGASQRVLGANERIVVGIMGMGGRGRDMAQGFAAQPNVEVAYVCDVDRNRAGQARDLVAKATGKTPQAVNDFRAIINDKAVDALVVTTCNHWHAPATILACKAGKHVYVEKPCSHNPREGELMVAAARKQNRHVQMGNQRRSGPKIIEAITQLREGAIGRVYLAQSWYVADRPSIGRGQETAVPDGLDYDLWQGPAPRRTFRSNYLHYNWHWFWHWGNGELGNNGIHYLDLCRWGLDVQYPTRVTSSGGRYRFDDDQETPDTHQVSFDFDNRSSITWQGLSCSRLGEIRQPDVLFHGENGTLALAGGGYFICDRGGKVVRREQGKFTDADHLANFLAAIREKQRLNSEIEGAHQSTLLCHLGNVAHRLGRSLDCSPANGQIQGNFEAQAFWSREYHKQWEPVV